VRGGGGEVARRGRHRSVSPRGARGAPRPGGRVSGRGAGGSRWRLAAGGGRSAEPHLAADRAGDVAPWVPELGHDREVILAREVQDSGAAPALAPGGGEVLALPMVLGPLDGAHEQEERTRSAGSQVDRAVPPRHLRRELEGVVQV